MKIQYEFLRVGEVAEPCSGCLYLDVGNRTEPGVIDHHHVVSATAASFECTSSLIVARPELVTDWIGHAALAGEVRLVVHENPDFDCFAATYLASALLEAAARGATPDRWSQWAPALAEAARRMPGGYESYIIETHHRQKRDAPSGTAREMEALLAAAGHAPVSIASVRAGAVPGTHTAGFESADDSLSLTHAARSRRGFAAGALAAAQWILGRRGLHEFGELLDTAD